MDEEATGAVVRRLIDGGTDAIIGPATSAATGQIVDSVIGAGVILFSPSNTGEYLTSYEDEDLYCRTAPPDGLQAHALAERIVADRVAANDIVTWTYADSSAFSDVVDTLQAFG